MGRCMGFIVLQFYKYHDILKKNYYTARNVYHWDNKTDDEKKEILKISKLYLKYLQK